MPRVNKHTVATKKWRAANAERLTIVLYKAKDPSKERIKAAAARDGVTMNAFIVEAIRDKL